ncbi:MAG: carbon-nitrogen hydrolase family protein [Bacteroidota bacterium]
MIKIGIGQFSPVHLNLPKSLEKLAEIIRIAGTQQVQLLVLGETWLSGYPAWLDYCPDVGRWNNEQMKIVFQKVHESSITVPGPETDMISALAKEYHVVVCLGVNEKVTKGPGMGTIYNSVLIIGSDGQLLNHHRKLIPTFTEKLLYGYGDAHGLLAVDTSAGRLGASICWEHWMPLSRQALHDSGEQIHISLWPAMNTVHELASRHYALEGRCFVIAAAQLLQAHSFPAELQLPEDLQQTNKLVLRGGSCIIAPDGTFVSSPLFDEERLIIAEIDLTQNIRESMTLDTSGHYQRRDVFEFNVKRYRH